MDINVTHPKFSEISKKFAEMSDRQKEFSQSRSTFQIEKFIGDDEYTPVTKFRHLAYNSYVMMKSAKGLVLEIESIHRKINAIRENHTEQEIYQSSVDDLDIQLYKHRERINELELELNGILKEISVFESLCDQLERDNGKKFTYDDFEKDQPNYWKLRLSTQAHEDKMSMTIGISKGNYRSIRQAVDEPIIPESKNRITMDGFSSSMLTKGQLANQ